MMNTITLKVGTVEVLTSEIPRLIAEAITPKEQASFERITAIEKIVYATCSEDGKANASYSAGLLSENDLTRFGKACRQAGLPSLWEVIEKKDTCISKWQSYENAIKYHFPKLDYKLNPCSSTVLQINAEQHREYLEDAVENGDIVAHDCITHIPLNHAKCLTTLEKAYMTVSAFTQYAAKFNLNVVVDGNKSSASPNQHDSACEIPPPCIENLNTINKLAVQIAWEIESKNGGLKVKPKLVITKLREMVADKIPKYSFLKSLSDHGIRWATTVDGLSEYDIGACRATLNRWYKRRDIEKNNSSFKTQNQP